MGPLRIHCSIFWWIRASISALWWCENISNVRPLAPLRCITVIQLSDLFSIMTFGLWNFCQRLETGKHITVLFCVDSERSGRRRRQGERGMGRTWKREHHYSDTQLFALCAVWVMHLRAEAKYSECFEMEGNSVVAMGTSVCKLARYSLRWCMTRWQQINVKLVLTAKVGRRELLQLAHQPPFFNL